MVERRSHIRQPALQDVTRNRSNRFLSWFYCVAKATPCAAFVMIAATACGCDT
jgi:hypothetical protein